jgi:periplasmic divalent cation tolerance protein
MAQDLDQKNLPQYGIVFVTASSQPEAEAIAQALLQCRLAACVSLTPIRSLYTWKGDVQDEAEWQLMIKTELQNFPQIEAKVRELHSYEVPEVIALPIVAGSEAYLSWISEQVRQI